MWIAYSAGAASLLAWIYLFFFRGGFWRVRASADPPPAAANKSVAAVVPARNEEAVIGPAIASLVNQDYPSPFHVFLVDDHSTDATIQASGTHERLSIVHAGPIPAGWTGKLWAISEGLKKAERFQPDYILLTDADIVHAPDSLTRLIARAEAEHLDLTSWMVKLRCGTLAERALIPAFVFFFFMLYPPAWIASLRHKTAGAAGGCILIRSSALARIGGISAIRSELIDDCALARAVKPGGLIWLGMTEHAHSIRPYDTFAEIGRMISRSAFTELRHSAWLLAATIIGMAVIYLAPPLLLLTRDPLAMLLGLAAWMLMSISYLPMLRFYRRSSGWAPLLPLIALFYMGATVDSALRYWTGRGGEWKGRIQGSIKSS
ncbi:MAG TPA: glycosyltransferase [Bryobacteraceae bacterium]|nr:glycosyltransferase [Bryobacteraceae bacterium]